MTYQLSDFCQGDAIRVVHPSLETEIKEGIVQRIGDNFLLIRFSNSTSRVYQVDAKDVTEILWKKVMNHECHDSKPKRFTDSVVDAKEQDDRP